MLIKSSEKKITICAFVQPKNDSMDLPMAEASAEAFDARFWLNSM